MTPAGGPRRAARVAATLLVYSALSIATSWPLARSPLSLHVSRQFDIYVATWLGAGPPWADVLSAGARSAWPVGESLARADSFVFLVLSWLLSPLGEPWLPVAAVTLAGPVLGAWAAERFAARCVGAAFPWSLLAGATYAFGGIAATALLEGHVYVLFDPWLPLLAGAWWRATGPEGRLRDGLLAGLWWSLCLLTSAYVGIAATLLVVVVGLRGVRARPRLPALGGAAAVAAPVAAAYVGVFVVYGEAARRVSALGGSGERAVVEAGSATLGTLAGWAPTVDMSGHSIAPAIGLTSLALALLAPVVLRDGRAWRTLLGLAGVATALSLGPTLRLWPDSPGLPWLLSLLPSGSAASFFHFPVRLIWVAALALGALAARVAGELARTRPRLAGGLFVWVIVDVLLVAGAPLRSGRVPTAAPSAYLAAPADRAIIELFPRYSGMSTDLELYWSNLTCSYQAAHRRPIANRCLGAVLHSGPRVVLGEWITGAVLGPAPRPDVGAQLGALGFGAVAVHPALFAPADRDALLEGLRDALGEPLAASDDAGDPVVLFGVPDRGGTPALWADRYRALAAELGAEGVR